jgi:hypothetical protein
MGVLAQAFVQGHWNHLKQSAMAGVVLHSQGLL